jgi:N-methylhydantoinase A
MLGRMAPESFLGARMQLDLTAAERAIQDHIATPTGFELPAAALGVLRIAQTNMTYAIRALTVERGLDPREFAMCSYGGGGGLFAAEVADELGIATVVVPAGAANFSAAGILGSDYREDAARTSIQPLAVEAVPGLLGTLDELAAQVSRELEGFGFSRDQAIVTFRLDVRYRTQDDTITVELDPAWLADAQALLAGVRNRFVHQHNRLFGYGDADEPLEVVTLRCRGTGKVNSPAAQDTLPMPPGTPRASRDAWFTSLDGPLQADIFERSALAPEQDVIGPAIVEEWNTTTLVPPGWYARTHRRGHLILRRGASG